MNPNLLNWLPPAAVIGGLLCFAFGVADLEFGRRLSTAADEGYIQRGIELVVGAGVFAAGVRVTPSIR